jgi:hypothetical protein
MNAPQATTNSVERNLHFMAFYLSLKMSMIYESLLKQAVSAKELDEVGRRPTRIPLGSRPSDALVLKKRCSKQETPGSGNRSRAC